MDKFIGTKSVHAKEMSREQFIELQKGTVRPPLSEEEIKENGYFVKYEDGYESWSPKSVFEKAYKKTDGMTFGLAIEAMKKGCRIARKGWNGKGMFVVYQKGYPEGIPCNKQTAEAYGYNEGDLFKCRPYMQMRCADGTHQMWLASQSDILENDWYIVE